jgi:hypothetical protein
MPDRQKQVEVAELPNGLMLTHPQAVPQLDARSLRFGAPVALAESGVVGLVRVVEALG